VSGNSAPWICRSTGQKPAGTSFVTTAAVNNHARSGTPTIKMKTATGCGFNKTAPCPQISITICSGKQLRKQEMMEREFSKSQSTTLLTNGTCQQITSIKLHSNCPHLLQLNSLKTLT